MQKCLEALYALVPSDELPFGDGDFFLEAAVLLHELPLYVRELLEVALEERHLLLLCPVVGRSQHVVVLLARFVEGYFEFDDLAITFVSTNEGGLPKENSDRSRLVLPARIDFAGRA